MFQHLHTALIKESNDDKFLRVIGSLKLEVNNVSQIIEKIYCHMGQKKENKKINIKKYE